MTEVEVTEDEYSNYSDESLNLFKDRILEVEPNLRALMIISTNDPVGSTADVTIGGLSSLHPAATLDVLLEMAMRFAHLVDDMDLLISVVTPFTDYMSQRAIEQIRKSAGDETADQVKAYMDGDRDTLPDEPVITETEKEE